MKRFYWTIAIQLAFCSTSMALRAQDSVDSTWRNGERSFSVHLTHVRDSKSTRNAHLILSRSGHIILSDSLSSDAASLNAKDMNGDGFKDLLVYESSGARANERYHLYLYQKNLQRYKRVMGFNAWPNMDTTTIRGIVCSMSLTGTVVYKFFRITESGELVDLHVSTEDKKLDGKAYDDAIQQLKKVK